MEEELQPNSDFFLKSYTYLEAQIKVQSEMEWGPNQPQKKNFQQPKISPNISF